uniref:Ig-like domain-containing protein n=1 Tax=Sciurus vulgaris TaxID=55149 RepID=A0A8D2B7T0_SCIVU
TRRRLWPSWLCPRCRTVSGCAPLSGPSKVTGTVGGSLSVQCRYEEEHKDKPKSWCKKTILCNDFVKTTDSEREVRNGRVSISDHPANLSLTVTMEHLTLEDAGSYECQVDTPWNEGFDPGFRVEVTVLPALTTASSPESPTSTQGPPMSLSTHTWPVTTREDSPHQQPGPWVQFPAPQKRKKKNSSSGHGSLLDTWALLTSSLWPCPSYSLSSRAIFRMHLGYCGVLCGTALARAGLHMDPSGHRSWV